MDPVTEFVFELFVETQEPSQKGFDKLEQNVERDWDQKVE